MKPNVFQADLIAPAAVQGPWTCVQAGGWSSWAPTDRLAPVPATPAITTEQWLGTWSAPRVGRLVLSRSAAGHRDIHVEGMATSTNIAHNPSSGEVSGDAVAMGPFLHIVDSGCILDLRYNLLTKSFALSTINNAVDTMSRSTPCGSVVPTRNKCAKQFGA